MCDHDIDVLRNSNMISMGHKIDRLTEIALELFFFGNSYDRVTDVAKISIV